MSTSTKFLSAQPQVLRNPSWFAHGIVQMVEDGYAHMFQDAETGSPWQTVWILPTCFRSHRASRVLALVSSFLPFLLCNSRAHI